MIYTQLKEVTAILLKKIPYDFNAPIHQRLTRYALASFNKLFNINPKHGFIKLRFIVWLLILYLVSGSIRSLVHYIEDFYIQRYRNFIKNYNLNDRPLDFFIFFY